MAYLVETEALQRSLFSLAIFLEVESDAESKSGISKCPK